jgi:hypothetical protein
MTSLVQAQAPALHDLGGNLPEAPEGARLVPLTRGLFAIIDEADFERVSAHRWYAVVIPAGYVYARSTGRIDGRRQYLHQFVLGIDGRDIGDHRNGDGLDNRRSNLRRCSHKENIRNQRTALGKVLPKGVSPKGKKYAAKIRVDGRLIWLGVFETITEATLAYDTAAKQFFGEYARLNTTEEEGSLDALDHAWSMARRGTGCLASERPRN